MRHNLQPHGARALLPSTRDPYPPAPSQACIPIPHTYYILSPILLPNLASPKPEYQLFHHPQTRPAMLPSSPLPLHILFLLLPLLPLSHTYTCTPTPHPLPLPKQCHDLIDALTLLSSLPPNNVPKLWSRTVEDTLTTAKLPKDYWLQGRGPETCAVHIDATDHGGEADWRVANETFALRNVANVLEIVVEQCVVRRRQLGWGCPGVEGRVGAGVVRTDAPWLRRGARFVRKVGLGVWEATDLEGVGVGGNGNGEVGVER